MAEQDEGLDKSFEASPQRLKQARQKGNVPQSPEVLTLARYTGLLIGVMAVAGTLASGAGSRLLAFLDHPLAASGQLFTGSQTIDVFSPVAMLVFGMLALSSALAIVGAIAQQSVTFAPNKIKPDLKKLSPLKNAANKFGPAGMIEFLKASVKVLAVMAMAGVIATAALPSLLASVGAPPAMLLSEMRSLTVQLLIGAVILAAAAAAIDVPIKWSQHAKRLRMTRQEVQDENKESEGSPEQKRTRQERARAIAQNRQLADVPMADVVIVNPEHYAVALKWNRSGGEVPRCVAKGVDQIAARIRQKAKENDVPIYRDVVTARSLHATIEVGEEIRRDQYEAVAAAIRFADGLREQARNRPWRKPSA